MSTDYQYDVLIGFTVPVDKLYDREKGSRWSCEHAEKQLAANSLDLPPKHCSECGERISKVEESQLILKPEFAAIIEDDWYNNIGWEGDLAGVKIWLTQYYTDEGDEVRGAYFAGVEVASFYHREDLGVRREDVPQIPSESDVADFLKASGIPFDSESWGLWMIGTAY
jgi:hypothetical protein